MGADPIDTSIATLGQAIEQLRAGHNRYEVANDLALLHGHLTITRSKSVATRAHLRLIKREELEDEVARGEHDDHDWQAE